MTREDSVREWHTNMLIVLAAKRVARRIPDSTGAQYHNSRVVRSEGGVITVCGEVNAKGRRGKFTGFRRFMAGVKSVVIESSDAPNAVLTMVVACKDG